MLLRFLYPIAYLLALSTTSGVNAQIPAPTCSNFVINDYSRQTANLNSFGGWTSDEGSMDLVLVSGNQLTLRPRDFGSFFYMTDFCPLGQNNILNRGLSGVEFTVAISDNNYGGSITINLQTGCQQQMRQNNYKVIPIPSGVSSYYVRLPFSEFGPYVDLTQIASIGFEGLSPLVSQFTLSPISFYCSDLYPILPGFPNSVVTPTPTQPVVTMTIPPISSPNSTPGVCSADLIVEDMLDPFRSTLYNALVPPGRIGTNGIMQNVTISKQRMSFKRSYPYSEVFFTTNCRDTRSFEGISFPVTIPQGGSMSIRLDYGGNICSPNNPNPVTRVIDIVRDMGIAANGQEQIVSIPLSRFGDTNSQPLLDAVRFGNLTSDSDYKIGAIRFYCKGSPLTPIVPPPAIAIPPVAPMNSPFPSVPNVGAMVIEDFVNHSYGTNALGAKHGGRFVLNSNRTITIRPHRPTDLFYTGMKGFPCSDLTQYKDGYLHVTTSIPPGQDFDIALEQYDSDCGRSHRARMTAFSQVTASRYMLKNGVDIYIPLSHFNVDFKHVGDVVFRSWRNQSPVILSRIEIVTQVPAGIQQLPGKQPETPMNFECTVPNTFAFVFDNMASETISSVLQILREENVKATFFVTGIDLIDPSRKLEQVYRQAVSDGHQLGFHSYSDPYFSKLEEDWEIDRQLTMGVDVIRNVTGASTVNYFKAPFGDIDSRVRLRLSTRNMKLIQWSIRMRTTQSKGSQAITPFDAFKRDMNAGGSIVQANVYDASTLALLRQFIQEAKSSGRRVVRVDQCLGDSSAPAI